MGETSLQLEPDSVFVEGGSIGNQLGTRTGVWKPPPRSECLAADGIQRFRLASHFLASGDGVSNPSEAHTPAE